MARVLVVEDSADVRALIAETLAELGHDVACTGDGRAAIAAFRDSGADLVVLDLMLPLLDGSAVLAAIRAEGATPVLVVSAKDAVWSRIDLLTLGADDYLVKPFDLGELAARVTALLRRAGGAAARDTTRVLRHGPLALDEGRAVVTVDGHHVDLTATEFRILRALLERPGYVRSRADLHEAAWGEPFRGDDATVKSHVSHLRAKLRDAGDDAGELVETVWGLGYRLAALPTGP